MSESKKPRLDRTKFTARNVSKYIVKAAIQLNVQRIAKNALVDYVGLDPDGIPVKLGAHVIAWGVTDNLKPYTDKMVDKTADFAVQQFNEQKAKREAKKTDKPS